MANLIEWYVVELRLRLAGKLPREKVDDIVREAENHLRESAAKLGSASRPELLAVNQYGQPDKVAAAHLGRRKLLGLPPVWWSIIASVVALFCWNFHLATLGGYFDSFGALQWNYLAGIAGFAALALILMAAARSCRSHWRDILAANIAFSLVAVPVLSFWMISEGDPFGDGRPYVQGMSRFHLRRDMPTVQSTILKLRAYENYLSSGVGAWAAAKSAADLSPNLRDIGLITKEFNLDKEFLMLRGPEPLPGTWVRSERPVMTGFASSQGAYPIPRDGGIWVEVDGRVSVLDAATDFNDAKRAWATSGQTAVSDTGKTVAWLALLQRDAREAQSGRLFFFNPNLYGTTVAFTVFFLPVLLLCDLLGVAISRRRTHRLEKAIA